MTATNDLTAPPSRAGGTGQPEIPIDKGGPDKDQPTDQSSTGKQLALGLLFGLAFGFLLQKGGRGASRPRWRVRRAARC